MRTILLTPLLLLVLTSVSPWPALAQEAKRFDGKHYRGAEVGVAEADSYLKLLETSRSFFEPNPRYLNITMLYEPTWNGFVEGPTWDAWWIQNSYGTTLAALPFLTEPYVTFVQNAQDLWFNNMGDGKRKGAHDWVGPDGCLCDAANMRTVYYRQGDGRIDIHDWGMEFTAAGVVLQAELLLIGRDEKAIAHYLPLLKRSLNFIESRRDKKNNLFFAGPAGNLLAPSYAGWKKPDGTYDKAYLAGLSITYIAALDRTIELAKLVKDGALAADLASRRSYAAEGLKALQTEEGYFIRSMDPDGKKHGVFGAKQHGYFEASPNHDAIAHRIVSDEQAEKIYQKIKSIPQLRPHALIIPNYPGYDDMYERPEGLWRFGNWVNGGHWSTCEGRMLMAYARLEKFEDIRASNKQFMKFANSFRMDNNLTNFGDDVYQPNQPINITYDIFAIPAATVRGIFEYVYLSQSLDVIPHLPESVTELEQLDPIRFGTKRIYIRVMGAGEITSAFVNDEQKVDVWKKKGVTLKYDELPKEGNVLLTICRGGAAAEKWAYEPAALPSGYAEAHAKLIADAEKVAAGMQLPQLPEASRAAAEKIFREVPEKLRKGATDEVKRLLK
ncbi:MAG TPA: hypothetical protein VF669_23890 [Tepidisphaeraceae bacterium]|jgi:hypothetical protein